MKKEKIDLSSDQVNEQLECQTLANLVLDSKKFLDKTQKLLGGIGIKVFTGTRRLAYELLLKRKEAKKPINAHLLDMDLKKEKVAEAVRGQFVDMVGSADLVDWTCLEEYLKELKDLAIKRERIYQVDKFKGAITNGKDSSQAKEEFDQGWVELESKTEKVKRGMTLLESLATPVKEPLSPIGGGFLAPERYTTLAAQDGEGKTTICTQLALCAASGVTFLGRFPIKKPCRVIYFCGENSRGDINDKTTFQMPELEKIVKGGDASKYLENFILVKPLEIDFTLDRQEDRGKLGWWLKTYKPAIAIFDPVADFVGTEKSLSDDILARKTVKTLNVIAREFRVFPILVLHFKKESEELKDIFEKPHGSKYFVNSAAAQICMERADKIKYEAAKRIHCKFKLVTGAPNFLVLRDRDTLWYSEIDKDEISKAKLLPKHIANFILEKCKGKGVPTLLYDTAAEHFNCSQVQVRELVKLAIDQGLIEKRRGILIPLIVKKQGKGNIEAEEEDFG